MQTNLLLSHLKCLSFVNCVLFQSLPVIYPSNGNGQFTISGAVQGAAASVAFNDNTG